MNKYFKRYIGVIVAWLILIVVGVVYMPNFSKLVTDNGSAYIPSSMQSQVANTIGQEFKKDHPNSRQVYVVFNSGKKKFSSEQISKVYNIITKLELKKKQLHINDMVTPLQSQAAQEQLVSKDGTSQILPLSIDKTDSLKTMEKKLQQYTKSDKVKTYVTSYDIIQSHANSKLNHGIFIALIAASVAILLALIFAFRSLILPFISLLGTLVAYFLSVSAIGNLVSRFDLPVSPYTQVVLLAVILILGTDYHVLFFNALKQRFNDGDDIAEAGLAARRASAKPILISGLGLAAVFGLMGLLKYSIFSSLAGVGIGIVILLLIMFTFTPFFAFALGEKVFLPSKNMQPAGFSRSWTRLSGWSMKFPILFLLLFILIAVPFVWASQGAVSYDGTREVSSKVPAKQGYEVIKDHFAKGISEPVTLYIKADHKLDNDADLKEIDRITNQLQQDNRVKYVTSVTQPQGQPLEQLYMRQQMGIINGNLDSANNSLKDIAKNLKKTKIDTKPLNRNSKNATTISEAVSRIQSLNEQNGVTETPSQIVERLQQQLRSSGRKRMTRTQRAIVAQAIRQSMSDRQIQNRMNNALEGIGKRTTRISSAAESFKTELDSIQSSIFSASNQIGTNVQSINSSNDFLKDLAKSSAGDTFYVPDEILKSSTFQDAIKAFLSGNKKTAEISIVLKNDPNKTKALKYATELNNDTKIVLEGTSLENSTIAVKGQTSQLQDQRILAKPNFLKLAAIVIAGLALIMLFVSKSLLKSLYTSAMLFVTYLMSLGFTKWMSLKVLHQNALTANAAFLALVLIFAFGASYAMYILSEAVTDDKQEQTLKMQFALAMRGILIGFSIFIMIVVMAGLMFSEQLTMIQVGMAVIFGFIFLSLALPIVLPALMRLTYDNHLYELLGSIFRRNPNKQKKAK
ncbi:MMPL family transporter [Lentilactobacillus sp. Marseille-Q4993]|uniref:MMPL family transporter n=1 Tax=Lentilactobacillus sp. Marseille-Q4993 TaxID=3039492 RepID=UPI0024BCEA52|nr:MMPL family transporter [Lentilactobacillus sp. Marseille-Q4993]